MNRRKFLQHSGLGVGRGALRGLAAVTADPADRVASAAPVQWAMREVQAALDERHLSARVVARGGLTRPPESRSLAAGQDALVASGSDVRGLVYALLEVADRVRYAGSLKLARPFAEKPANTIRSINRCFESDVEDKS